MKEIKRYFTYMIVASLLLAGAATPVNAGRGLGIERLFPIHILCSGDPGQCPCAGC